jgi:hypothetical protein
MIIYGTNRYALKVVKPEELGFTGDTQGIRQFELIQRYAHIFWIPIFPIGQTWCARKTDNKLYHLNGALEDQLKNIPYSKTAIIPAFAGLILALLIWGFYTIRA